MKKLNLLAIIIAVFTIYACEKNDIEQQNPTTGSTQTATRENFLVNNQWRLMKIESEDGIVEGESIKDRFLFDFYSDKTFNQTLIEDSTVFTGSFWSIEDINVLVMKDHKGSMVEYNIISISDDHLIIEKNSKDGNKVFYFSPNGSTIDENPTSEILISHTPWVLMKRENGQDITEGDAIKDRFAYNFREDGSYQQLMLADSTVYEGSNWSIKNNSILTMTGHKGTVTDFDIVTISDNELIIKRTQKESNIKLYFNAD